jgi:PAS domain S-box-containing protein
MSTHDRTTDDFRGPVSSAGDRYRQILDTAPDAMVVVDHTGTISFANLQTETIFGYRRDELLGKPLEVLIPERFRATHGGHMARYYAQPSTRHMGSGLALFGRRADGTEMDIEVSLAPVHTSGGMLVCAAIRDISERKTHRGDGQARRRAARERRREHQRSVRPVRRGRSPRAVQQRLPHAPRLAPRLARGAALPRDPEGLDRRPRFPRRSTRARHSTSIVSRGVRSRRPRSTFAPRTATPSA